MRKKDYIFLGVIAIFFFLFSLSTALFSKEKSKEEKKENHEKIVTTVIKMEDSLVTVQDENHGIYTFELGENLAKLGDRLVIEYSGVLNKEMVVQRDLTVTSVVPANENTNGIPSNWQDSGIFKNFYEAAYKKLQTMSMEEKIGQLLLVRYPSANQVSEMKKYHLGGFVFFEKDFKDKTEAEVKQMISNLQKSSSIPLLTAVDEEGGKIVRISSNPNLVETPFLSSQALYAKGGFDAIINDTKNKSRILKNLGLNINLAPVVDVATDQNAYIYERTLGKDTDLTATYAKGVIEASLGGGVSYTLKHFPGYGNNQDTHNTATTDTRSLENLKDNDFPPFQAGIEVGAEAVLVSHNTLVSIDPDNPASLSPTIHNLLRNDLGFTGIVITDDLAMGATSGIANATVKALQAGNDLIITTDYQNSVYEIQKALQDGVVDNSLIDKAAFRILAWKYYKGLMFENEK